MVGAHNPGERILNYEQEVPMRKDIVQKAIQNLYITYNTVDPDNSVEPPANKAFSIPHQVIFLLP